MYTYNADTFFPAFIVLNGDPSLHFTLTFIEVFYFNPIVLKVG